MAFYWQKTLSPEEKGLCIDSLSVFWKLTIIFVSAFELGEALLIRTKDIKTFMS